MSWRSGYDMLRDLEDKANAYDRLVTRIDVTAASLEASSPKPAAGGFLAEAIRRIQDEAKWAAPAGWRINNPNWPSGDGPYLVPEEGE